MKRKRRRVHAAVRSGQIRALRRALPVLWQQSQRAALSSAALLCLPVTASQEWAHMVLYRGAERLFLERAGRLPRHAPAVAEIGLRRWGSRQAEDAAPSGFAQTATMARLRRFVAGNEAATEGTAWARAR